jgi:hypothetical protein
MKIITPTAMADVTCTRASVKWVYDRTGTLVSVPANTLAVTYDPSDLTKAPYALVEPAATNLAVQSEVMSVWQSSAATVQTDVASSPSGTLTVDRVVGSTAVSGLYRFITLNPGDITCASIFVKRESGDTLLKFGTDQAGTTLYAVFDISTGKVSSQGSGVVAAGVIACNTPNGLFYRLWVVFAAPIASTPFILYSAASAATFQAWGFQVETGKAPTSYIPTTAAGSVTRPADVIGAGSGLVYSNVAIVEPAYSAATTYAKDDKVYDPTTHNVFQSLIAGNVNKALTDTSAWTPRGAMNRWAMLDQYNSTQTSNAEEIVIVIAATQVSRGLFLANLDATEVRISTVDLSAGLVSQLTKSLIQSNSGSSFYGWGFGGTRRQSYYVSAALLPYANTLTTITIRKPGGTAKCGVAALGPVLDLGMTQYGVAREIKDYSTVNFNFDGTSNVQKRNFAKVLSLDVVIENDQIDSAIETLENCRQTPLVWLGVEGLGHTCLFGPYTSFKSVLPYPTQSIMSLQIQATV